MYVSILLWTFNFIHVVKHYICIYREAQGQREWDRAS